MRWCLQNRDTGIEIHPLSHLQVPASQLVLLTLTCLLTLSISPKHTPDPLGSPTPWISAWSSHSLPFLLKFSLAQWWFAEVAPQHKGRTGLLAACACSTINSHLRQPLTQVWQQPPPALLQPEFQQESVPVVYYRYKRAHVHAPMVSFW